MNIRRIRKQTLYAVGFFVVLYGLVAVITGLGSISPFFTPKPSSTPSPIAYQDIIVEEIQAIEHPSAALGIGATVDIVARLRNPNPAAGIADYKILFTIKDKAGQPITSKEQTAYILPGAIQYVIALAVPVGNAAVGEITVVTPNKPAYIPVTSSAPRPRFSSFARPRIIRNLGDRVLEEQPGVVRNQSTVDWHSVEVAALALDETDRIIGVGQTFLGDLLVGQERDFIIQWPAANTPVANVIIIPTTNIFIEENVLKVIGNPELLR